MWNLWQSLRWTDLLSLGSVILNLVTWVILFLTIRTQRKIQRDLNPSRRRPRDLPEL